MGQDSFRFLSCAIRDASVEKNPPTSLQKVATQSATVRVDTLFFGNLIYHSRCPARDSIATGTRQSRVLSILSMSAK
jgi:hypothetical protein